MSNEKKSKTLTKKEFDDFFNDLHEKINEKKKLLSLKKKIFKFVNENERFIDIIKNRNKNKDTYNMFLSIFIGKVKEYF